MVYVLYFFFITFHTLQTIPGLIRFTFTATRYSFPLNYYPFTFTRQFLTNSSSFTSAKKLPVLFFSFHFCLTVTGKFHLKKFHPGKFHRENSTYGKFHLWTIAPMDNCTHGQFHSWKIPHIRAPTL